MNWNHDAVIMMLYNSLCLNFVHLLARKPNLEKQILLIQTISGKWVSTKTDTIILFLLVQNCIKNLHR